MFLHPHPHTRSAQRGAALMVMIAIMVIAIAAILVGALNSSALKIARDRVSADAMAQAKDALIGYAASDVTRPGELPCPDVNDDGMLTMNIDFIGNNCVSPIGRLPWKSLGLTELRDGAGEHLWYAVAKTFWANGTTPINSDTVGDLTVSGNTAGSNVIAIIFAPGQVINGQSRSAANQAACVTQSGASVAESLCATNYLEGSNAALNLAASPNPNYQSSNPAVPFNDQIMMITPRDLLAIVEKRVAKELKAILANYKAENGVYPYPAKLNGCTFKTNKPSNSSCDSDPTQCRGWIPLSTPAYGNWSVPTWFINNGWYRSIHYAADTSVLGAYDKDKGSWPASCSPSLNIAGTPTGALFFMPGTANLNQSRPSNSLSDYLEDAENQNLDSNYVQPGATANDTLYKLP